MMALVSSYIFCLALFAPDGHWIFERLRLTGFTRQQWFAYYLSLFMTLLVISILILVGVQLLKLKANAIRLCLWFFVAETVLFVISTDLPSYPTGAEAFYPQLITGYPLVAGAVLGWSLVMHKRASSRRQLS